MNHNQYRPDRTTQPASGAVLEFGSFKLDPTRAALTRAGIEVPLRPKCFNVLRYLAENPGRLVTKDELIAAIWPGLVVTESSLPQCMVEVRRALGEEARQLITTLPRRGYRFEPMVAVPPLEPRSTNMSKVHFLTRGSRWAAVLGLAAFIALLGSSTLTQFPASTDAAAVNPAAQDSYLQGRYFQNRRGAGDMQRAIDYFRRATELDPGFADAWVGLASAVFLEADRAGNMSFKSWGPEFKAALDRALLLDPKNAEAHLRMSAFYTEIGDREARKWHFDQALRHGGEQALILSAAAGAAFSRSDMSMAAELQGRAVELDPLSFANQANLGLYLLFSGNPAMARQHLETARDLSPDLAEDVALELLHAHMLLKDFDSVNQLTLSLPDGVNRNFGLAVGSAAVDDVMIRDLSIRRLRGARSAEAALRLAEFYAWQNHNDLSRNWLQLAFDLKAQEADGCGMRTYAHEALHSPLLSRFAKTFPLDKS